MGDSQRSASLGGNQEHNPQTILCFGEPQCSRRQSKQERKNSEKGVDFRSESVSVTFGAYGVILIGTFLPQKTHIGFIDISRK